jgi:hypothetical protein
MLLPGISKRRRNVKSYVTDFWTPLKLANILGWYDFSDINTLFQDTARTSPVTTDDQSIKGVTNKAQDLYHMRYSGTLDVKYEENKQNGLSSAYFGEGINALIADDLGKQMDSAFILEQAYIPVGNANGDARTFGISDPGGSFEYIMRDETTLSQMWCAGHWSGFITLPSAPRSVATQCTHEAIGSGEGNYPRAVRGGVESIGAVYIYDHLEFTDFHLGQLVSYGYTGYHLETVICSSMTASEEIELRAYIAYKWGL